MARIVVTLYFPVPDGEASQEDADAAVVAVSQRGFAFDLHTAMQRNCLHATATSAELRDE